MGLAMRLAGVSLMVVALLALAVLVYLPGFYVSGATGSTCDEIAWLWEPWIIYGWAIVLLAGALVPPSLLLAGKRWRWVWISMGAGLVVSLAWYLAWFVASAIVCG